MPTHTPSPHRFLASLPPSSAQKPKPKPKPQSNLRHGFTAHTPKTTEADKHMPDALAETPKVTPAKRFVIAPTRHISSGGTTNARSDEARASTQTLSTPRQKPRRSLQRIESIDEGSQESLSKSPTNSHSQDGVIQSIEHAHTSPQDQGEEDGNDDTDMLMHEDSNKRRRLSPQPPTSPSQLPPSSPQTPAPAPAASSHRFVIPAPRTPAPFPFPHTSMATATSSKPALGSSRPHFLLPSLPTSPPKPTTPLPETFSPSRKGQRFLPGGMASTLQSWIIETAATGYAAQTRDSVMWGRDKEDGVKFRTRIKNAQSGKVEQGTEGRGEAGEVECFAGGVVFVRGEIETGAEVKVLLAGQGGARGSSGVRLKEGSVVGIRVPMWDVDVGGEKWVVGVDWVVL